MSEKTFGLESLVRVQLTQAGINWAMHMWYWLRAYKKLEVDEDGWCETTFAHIQHLFGGNVAQSLEYQERFFKSEFSLV